MVLFFTVVLTIVITLSIVSIWYGSDVEEEKKCAREWYKKELLKEKSRMGEIEMMHEAQNRVAWNHNMTDNYNLGYEIGLKEGQMKAYEERFNYRRRPTDWDYGLED